MTLGGTQHATTRLLGRYMLANRREAKCTVIDLSTDRITLTGPEVGTRGERVILYIDLIGRVEGTIQRVINQGFELSLDLCATAKKRIARRLQQVPVGEMLGPLSERRQEVRVKLEGGRASTADGHACTVVDFSLTGADVRIAGQLPPLGAVL